MIRANLTGSFENGAWRLRPQASLTHFEETQDSYVDSLNITIPEQTVRIGRLTAGPEVAWRHTTRGGGFIELNTNLQAVWDYDAAGQLSEAGLLVATDDNVRADARFGASTRFSNGTSIRLETGFAGLGMGKFEATTARFELRIPFGARGGSGGAMLGGAMAGVMQQGCDDPAGQGFAFAAGQMTQCDGLGLGNAVQ